MTKFHCKRCNYNFSFETEKTPKSCPYCDNENCVSKEQTAEELLDEVD